MSAPYRYERAAWRSGLKQVAGVDEAGRGPLAGPVVAAAVILDPTCRVSGLDDSKRLSPTRREALFQEILIAARAVATGIVDPQTIDRVNILEATRRAMYDALRRLALRPDLVLIDALRLPALAVPQKPIIKGDSRSASIAAASIVAKVTRDRLMLEADGRFPQYGFARHKGYPTPEHRAALERHGPCPIHRRTFHGVWIQGDLFERS
ncbi:MAG: ribonuclease HII [Candidatus Rokubacteria bacterium]|nr:ribonuclease HII [Candidatus Rokubacteria bacterium]